MSDRRFGPWLQTYSGRRFYIADPRPEDVDPADIAWALAHIPRYGGHAHRFHSVAEHSVLLSHLVPEEHALAALLHDSPEAYLGDVITPLKGLLPDYAGIERNVWHAIARAFRLDPELPAAVKQADRTIVADERREILGAEGEGARWDRDTGPGFGIAIAGLAPPAAALAFLERLLELHRWESPAAPFAAERTER